MRDICGSAFDSNISKSSSQMVWFGLSRTKRQRKEKRKERGEAASVRVAN